MADKKLRIHRKLKIEQHNLRTPVKNWANKNSGVLAVDIS